MVIQFVEIHYGGIGPGKAGMYDSQQFLSIAMTYPNASSGYSHILWVSRFSRRYAYTDFRRQTWATLYVWNGVGGNWKL